MGKMHGSCVCGAIKVDVDGDVMTGICHCIDCRKTSGTTAVPWLMCATSAVDIKGQPKGFTTRSSNKYEVKRWFCPECGSGTHLTMPNPEMVGLMGGLFPPHTLPPPNMELFCKNKESWEASFGDNVRVCDEQPDWAAEAAEREKAGAAGAAGVAQGH
ncbi:hypothetical protein EHS25_005300 [Saitozyma podzolica]|uniref:CENP-V/GFA domain-containing protein n=1 Tax=Saitozyma podzolica TaxID=1890683 RepID=A0A427XZB2_9TREE|nr:hypothetical protein EHS25_005300 [Saitozyma podzolica]